MTEAAEKISAQAMQLISADRAELAKLLVLSLDEAADDGAEAAWDAELGMRVQRIEAGESPGRPAEDVLAKLRAKYAR